MNVREMRIMMRMTQAEFSKRYGIPKRSIENWEARPQTMPTYLNKLLERAVREDREQEGNMKKYEIRENSIEIRYRDKEKIVQGCTLMQDDDFSEVLEAYSTAEAAVTALGRYKTEIRQFSSAIGLCYKVTEYYVEENDYDEDDEWISGGDVVKFTEMPDLEEE